MGCSAWVACAEASIVSMAARRSLEAEAIMIASPMRFDSPGPDTCGVECVGRRRRPDEELPVVTDEMH